MKVLASFLLLIALLATGSAHAEEWSVPGFDCLSTLDYALSIYAGDSEQRATIRKNLDYFEPKLQHLSQSLDLTVSLRRKGVRTTGLDQQNQAMLKHFEATLAHFASHGDMADQLVAECVQSHLGDDLSLAGRQEQVARTLGIIRDIRRQVQ